MDNIILNKLNDIENRFLDLSCVLQYDFTDVEKLKEYSQLQEIIALKKSYDQAMDDMQSCKEEISKSSGEEEIEFFLSMYKESEQKAYRYEQELVDALTEKDPNDACNAIFEISGEVGGDEANLFARDLYLMYVRYAEKCGFKVETIDDDKTNLGGFNYVSFKIVGNGAYGVFKYESGIHRVQRVPETEAKGRLHTSTASVMVIPELNIYKFELDLNDVDITTCHASGAGGQHINKTSSAIRATYKPTGLTVFCQSRRSQLQNKEEALRILASRLKAEKEEKEAATSSANKASVLGTRDRSEKIRTYNYPQNRITDHRIGLSILKLDRMMLGDLDELIQALHIEARKEKNNDN